MNLEFYYYFQKQYSYRRHYLQFSLKIDLFLYLYYLALLPEQGLPMFEGRLEGASCDCQY